LHFLVRVPKSQSDWLLLISFINSQCPALAYGDWQLLFEDTFDRPNGAPGSHWITPVSNGQGDYLPALDIVENQLCSTTQAVALLNASAFDPTQTYRITYNFRASENEVCLLRVETCQMDCPTMDSLLICFPFEIIGHGPGDLLSPSYFPVGSPAGI
jgi:hypothetical protein